MLPILITAVQKAAVAISELRSDTIEVTMKGEQDFLTAADSRSQEVILEILQRELSGIDIVAEEQTNPQITSTSYLTVDPIDGTYNFINGAPEWAITIGYIENGKAHAGIIYMPDLNVMITAEKGKGTFHNQKKITLPQPKALKHSVIGAEAGWYVGKELLQQKFLPLSLQCLGVRCPLASTASINEMLLGRTRAYVHLKGGKVWDFAAGAIAIEEAGGVTCTIDGSPLSWDEIYMNIVFANRPALAQEIVNIIG